MTTTPRPFARLRALIEPTPAPKLDTLDRAALALLLALAVGCGVGGWTTGRALVWADAHRAAPLCTTDSECAATPQCKADPTCDGGPQ